MDGRGCRQARKEEEVGSRWVGGWERRRRGFREDAGREGSWDACCSILKNQGYLASDSSFQEGLRAKRRKVGAGL